MNVRTIKSAPIVDRYLEEFPSLRSRALEVERRLRLSACDVAETDITESDSPTSAKQEVDNTTTQPLVVRSIIDLVEGRSLRIERALWEVLGVSERRLMESSFLERVHPDDRLRTMREMERVAAGKMLEGFRIRHRHADGTFLLFEWAAVADDAGELCYAVAMVLPEDTDGGRGLTNRL